MSSGPGPPASTCLEWFSGQFALFVHPESSLPGQASPFLVQLVQQTAYVPVVNVGTTKVLLYQGVALVS